MKLQHFLGEFKDMAAVQAAFPGGGSEGDYLVVDGVIKGWDIESNTWADPIKKDVAPVRATEQVFGDLDVHHNIRVGGNLSAKLIRGRNAFLGLFADETSMRLHFPTPSIGEWAMVLAYTIPATANETNTEETPSETSSNEEEVVDDISVGYIYICEEPGVWKATGKKGGFGSNMFEAVEAEKERAQTAEEAEKERAQTAEETLQDNINTINSKIPAEATSANKLADKAYVDDADTNLQNSIQDQTKFYTVLNDPNDNQIRINHSEAPDFVLSKACSIKVRFMNGVPEDEEITLNINNTGEKPLYVNGVPAHKGSWYIGDILQIFYSGTRYEAFNMKVYDEGVFDLSIYKADSDGTPREFASIQDAISTPYMIPSLMNKGGITVRFINSDTHRYEWWRYKGQNEVSLDITEWEKCTDKKYVDDTVATKVAIEAQARQSADETLQGNIDAIESLIPSQASRTNKLTDEELVNSKIATATATHRGSFNLVTDLGGSVADTREQIAIRIANKLATLAIVPDNNDYVFVQVPNTAEKPDEILRVERYKFNGNNWGFEYELNNSSFTAAQWAALNSGITSTIRETMQADIAANQAKIAALAAGIDVNISFHPSVIYKNVETSVTVTGTMVNGVPTNMKLMDGETVIHEGAASPLSDQVHVNISTDTKTFKVVGESSGVTLSKEGDVNARYPIYYGFAPSPSVLAVDELARYAPTTSAAHTYSRENNRDGQHFYILVPSDISALSNFTMNGAPFVMAASTEVINEITYKVYTSGNTYNAGTQVTVVAS